MTRAFDLADWGRLAVNGPDARDLLDRLLSQDVKGMAPGDVRPACLLDERGRVVLFVDVACLGADSFLLVADPGGRDRLLPSIERYVVTEDVRLAVLPPPHVHVAGGGADEVLARLGGAAAAIFPADRTGAPGRDVVGGPGIAAAAAAGAEACGADVLEALRIEAGIPRLGREIDDATIPLEVGLARACVTTKCYVGQEVVARIEARGHVHRALVRLALAAPVEAGAPLRLGGHEVGRVTSVAGRRALGVVRREAAATGTRLEAGPVGADVVG